MENGHVSAFFYVGMKLERVIDLICDAVAIEK